MRIYKKDENWFIDFWYRGKRYRRKVCPDKRQAELALKKVQVSIVENKFFDIKKQQKILFSETVKEYLERYSRTNKKSWEKDESILRRFLPVFGDKYLYEITPLMIEDFKAKRLAEGRKPATVNRQLACLKHLFTKMIEWGKATENPVKKVKLFKVDNQRTRFLEKGEIKVLLDVCPEYLKPIIAVAFNTGMRQSEILNLTWDDVDLVRGLIEVKNTKNNERRYIPMNSVLLSIFQNLKENCNPTSPYVFTDRQGGKLIGRTLQRWFNEALEKTGIKNFRFHDLRHTFASYLVMSGADIITVKELLGHKTLEMTLRYSHLSPNFKRSTVELLCKQPDTFWTLGQISKKEEEKPDSKNITFISSFLKTGNQEVAECLDIQNGQE